MKRSSHLFGVFLIVMGIFIYSYPIAKERYFNYATSEHILTFQKSERKIGKEEDERYSIIKKYNQSIFEKKQEELRDVWSYEQVPTYLTCFKDRLFGYIEIPAMDTRLALYIGADIETLKKGAAILSQTSIPIGGKNLNCVIAGHRGYQGIPYFREIENLKIGDKIFIINPWEKLTYIVKETKIIEPDDSDKIFIQPGKDMITLLTCHPYASHGKKRYVVYCERKEAESIANFSVTDKKKSQKKEIFDSSKQKIKEEILIRKIAGSFLSFLVLIYFFQKIIRRESKKKYDVSTETK